VAGENIGEAGSWWENIRQWQRRAGQAWMWLRLALTMPATASRNLAMAAGGTGARKQRWLAVELRLGFGEAVTESEAGSVAVLEWLTRVEESREWWWQLRALLGRQPWQSRPCSGAKRGREQGERA